MCILIWWELYFAFGGVYILQQLNRRKTSFFFNKRFCVGGRDSSNIKAHCTFVCQPFSYILFYLFKALILFNLAEWKSEFIKLLSILSTVDNSIVHIHECKKSPQLIWKKTYKVSGKNSSRRSAWPMLLNRTTHRSNIKEQSSHNEIFSTKMTYRANLHLPVCVFGSYPIAIGYRTNLTCKF